MKTVDEIQKLLRNADAISNALKNWDEKYTQDSSCDKKGFQFNEDSRFSACDALSLYVSSWKGYYGNSGCSTILSVDKDVFNTHLLKVLRGRFREILEATGNSIRDEARKHKDEAKKELAEKLNSIETL